MSTTETEAAPKRPATEYTKVTMTDGRTVEFPGKRQLSKESLIPGQNGYSGNPAVRLDFVNGETRTYEIPGGELLTAILAGDAGVDLTDSDKARLVLFIRHATHGAEQKLGDELAVSPKKGDPEPTIEDKVEWIDELLGRLYSLEWSTQRQADPLAGAGVLVRALMELSGKSREEIRDFLKPMKREERAAIKLAPAVRKVIDRLEAEALAAKGVDASSALAGLGIEA